MTASSKASARFQFQAGGLDAEERRRLEELVAAAEERQARELDSATDSALRQVPSLLRPLLRRALGL